ncbi:MAG: hypothetical protein ABSG28_00550 [Methanoregula sp.]|jgi:hypothetical protein|uniref:hypothetical protein n=1 Tax=Methanoregula sp. TaxID=2052170 RepID=UPI003C1F29B3
MNGRYFGDTRDLFKFDLVRHIMKSLPELAGFTFVPMLTGTEGEGSRKNTAKKDLEKAYRSGKAGSQNRDLREHLTRLQEINDDVEYISGICAYFDKEMILIDIPGRQTFTNHDRDAYFQSIVDNFPKNSLIFLDPDTGLKDESQNSKHLLLSEVKTFYDRMDSGSILMIYQHFPRVKHEEYVRRACMQLEERTGSSPAIITDNEIVFFLLAKNQKLSARLKDILECYADTYPALQCGQSS